MAGWFSAKRAREGESLTRENEILMSYFDQLYEASAELADEHRRLLEICRCKDHRSDKLA